jgi:hypothetical protein
MGLPVTIDVRDDGIPDAAVAAAFDWLRWVDATFSTYRENSEIARLNRGALAEAEADPHVPAVLCACRALRDRTGGAVGRRGGGAHAGGAGAPRGRRRAAGRRGARGLRQGLGGGGRVGAGRGGAGAGGPRDRHLGDLPARGPHRGPPHGPPAVRRALGLVRRRRAGDRRRAGHRRLRHGADGAAWLARQPDEAMVIDDRHRVFLAPGFAALRV